MEIGIDKGGSILLWSQYFTNPTANIYALDCSSRFCMNVDVFNDIVIDNRVKIIDLVDAYLLSTMYLLDNNKFDVMVDDGPHTFESNKLFLLFYSHLISKNGILVIEDIQDYSYVYQLFEHVPEALKQYVEVYDMRDCNNQYDDILFVINKSGIIPTKAYDGYLTRTVDSFTIYKWTQ